MGNELGQSTLLITMLFQSAESRYNQWVREHYRFLLRSAGARLAVPDHASRRVPPGHAGHPVARR